jgi:hypothetical protein
LQNRKLIYDMADADRAWGKAVTLQSSAGLTGISVNNGKADSA